VADESRDCDWDENRASHQVGHDHRAPALEAVREQAPVEAKKQCRDAVGEADGEHAQRPGRLEREPHERDVLKRVAELARDDGAVSEAKIPPAKKAERSATPTHGLQPRLPGRSGKRSGHDGLEVELPPGTPPVLRP
jgi:hypothetical protein